MPESKHLRVLLMILYCLLGILGLWASVFVLFPLVAPFLLALILAAGLEPVIRFCGDRLHLGRRPAAALCTLLLWSAAALLVAVLAARLWYEASMLLRRLPSLISALPDLQSALERWAYRFVTAAPVSAQKFLGALFSDLAARALTVLPALYSGLLSAAAALAGAVPRVLLFLFTAALATYFASAGRPGMTAFFSRTAPPRLKEAASSALKSLAAVAGGWLRAEGILMALTFCLLAAGFFLLKSGYPVGLAGLVALLDALPVFGTGTVLLPWALLCFLRGEAAKAGGLLALYAVIWLARSLLEPRLLAGQIGLPTLAALFCMYAGFQLFGVAGMILLPPAAACGLQIWRALKKDAHQR